MDPVALFIDGKEVVLSPGATLKDGEVLVPLEAFGRKVGMKIAHLEEEKQVILCRDDLCVPLEVGDEKQGAVFLSDVAFASPAVFAEPMGLSWRVDAKEKTLRVFTGSGSGSSEVGLGVGDTAPEFTLPDLYTGNPVSLSDFRGQKAVFFMWASW